MLSIREEGKPGVKTMGTQQLCTGMNISVMDELPSMFSRVNRDESPSNK